MTLEEKIKYILHKRPATKYNRAEFMWTYLEEFHGAKVYILKKQFLKFLEEEAGLERKLRDVLKEEEFKPEPEQDQKRYEKAAELKKEYKNWKNHLSEQDQKDFKTAFGDDEDYKQFSEQCL